MRILMLCFMVIISGCASSQKWVKEGVTNETFQKDYSECEYKSMMDANRPVRSRSSSNDVNVYINPDPDPYEQAGKNFGNAFADSFERGMRQSKLLALCLKMKGYRKVEIDRSSQVPQSSSSVSQYPIKK